MLLKILEKGPNVPICYCIVQCMVLQAPGGRFANGLIPRQYAPGQDIVVKVKETPNKIH